MADKPLSFRALIRSGVVLPFAHRGAGVLAPENTFAAFRHAVDLGFPIIETDIQSSRDGTLYAFHDASLKRLTGTDRTIAQLSDADITDLRIDDQHPIPKLADLFEAFPETYFNLDAKTWQAVGPMADLIQKADARHRVNIGSFSEARIKAVLNRLGPDTSHSMGTSASVRFYFAAMSGLAQNFTAQCVQFPVVYKGVRLINQRNIAFAHRLGLKVHVWTVNDADEMHRLLDLGVDGLMTDDCALLKSVMASRNLWQSDYRHRH